MTIDQEGEKGFPSLRNLRKQSEKAGEKKNNFIPQLLVLNGEKI